MPVKNWTGAMLVLVYVTIKMALKPTVIQKIRKDGLQP